MNAVSIPTPKFQNHSQQGTRERLLMDRGWRFHLGDIPFPTSRTHGEAYGTGWGKSGAFHGAAHPGFNDAGWRAVDLPHDWVVEGTFTREAGPSHGYLPTGVGWYRKVFMVPAADVGKRLFLEFEGIFRNATVYLNGHRLGHEPSGYISYRYDISDQAIYGDENVLAVHVDAREGEGWWYEGAGIYRHVWLTKTAPLHFVPDGVFVMARLASDYRQAELTVQVTVANAGEHDLHGDYLAAVLDPDGCQVAEILVPFTVSAGAELEVVQKLSLDHPQLWSVEEPTLYKLQTVLLVNRNAVDEVLTSFGVRSIHFDPASGFFLNGRPMKIKGASNHQDHAGVGVAVPESLFEFRIKRLKEMGANAWRCAHNPPAPAFLDACDRLGMLVMDETRCMNSTLDGRRQLESMVRRDRNHPSVIIWSLGNEEALQCSDTGKRIIRSMKRWVLQLDSTRPVTLAMSGGWGEPVSPLLDVQGCNYVHDGYDAFHAEFPNIPMLVTENFVSGWSTRGEYENDEVRGLFSCYDKYPLRPGCIAEAMWGLVAEREFIAGTFPWTGFDYRGEPGPGEWPCVSSNFGILDTCGFPKDIFYYYQSWWSAQDVLHLFPHWNWPGREGEEIPVWCYSNCDEVELFLNGTSLGRKSMTLNGHLEWNVGYVPGTLLAKGYRKGDLVIDRQVETTDAAVALALLPERTVLRADGQDVAIVTVAVLDQAGRIVPDADSEIRFAVEGNASFLGCGNGNPVSHEPDKEPRHRVFHGLCQVLLLAGRKPGNITLHASASGLRKATLLLEAEQTVSMPELPVVDPATRIEFSRTGSGVVWSNKGVPPDGWYSQDFVEAGWESLSLVGKISLPSPSWIRIRFEVAKGFPTAGFELDLGAIHDYDEAWLNGVCLGSLHPGNTSPDTAWLMQRRYPVPPELLRPGQGNVLAIRAWNRRTSPDARVILSGPLRLRPVV